MTKTISKKQLTANRKNASKGGVKTQEGKDKVRFNAMRHGILNQSVTEYEEGIYEKFTKQLFEEFEPQGFVEEMLTERIAMCYIKLFRVAKAEKEYFMKTFDPTIMSELSFEQVEKEGYEPQISENNIAELDKTYFRYETSIENRLYKALHELERIQRSRNGEHVPSPIAVEINNNENGFVS